MATSENYRGAVFVMIGPGGAGKNAIMKAIMARFPCVRQLATATTRPKRADEKQGREHLFVSESEFKRMFREGELLECQEVTPGKFYGIPRASLSAALAAGGIRIADIEVKGAMKLAAAFPKNVVRIFVTVPGDSQGEQLDLLRRRMRERADQITDIDQRLERAKTLELPYQSQCDYVVVNDELRDAIEEAADIVRRELAARQLPLEAV